MLPQPCRLCDKAFPSREQFLLHVDAEHGGLQRYRNAFFCLASLRPHIVGGQEWRLAIASFNEFIARAATDWQHFTTSMTETLETAEGLPVDARWEPRRRAACVFCARLHWSEELKLVYLSGEHCFMEDLPAVEKLLSWHRYSERWPLIPSAELESSAVSLHYKDGGCTVPLLLQRRRVSSGQAAGHTPAHSCMDCYDAFKSNRPWISN